MAAAACPKQMPPSLGGSRLWRRIVNLRSCNLAVVSSVSR